MAKVEINILLLNEIENFIKNNIPKDEICISPKDRFKQNEAYTLIKNDNINTLYLFGDSGYRSYYYYKSCNNQIYLIETYLDKIDAYSEEI